MKSIWPESILPMVSLLCCCILVPSSTALAHNADTWRDANQVYQKICSHCHDTGIGPKLIGRKLPSIYIETIVRQGLRAMPAFRSSDLNQLTLEELAQLISDSTTTELANSDVVENKGG